MKRVIEEGTGDGRLPWSRPEVRRIDAGSAEASVKIGIPDGPPQPNGKEFS